MPKIIADYQAETFRYYVEFYAGGEWYRMPVGHHLEEKAKQEAMNHANQGTRARVLDLYADE